MRELENMIKRFVILQDEQLVRRELSRSPSVPALPSAPLPAHPVIDRDIDGDDGTEIVAPGESGRRLADVARTAALTAERAVIADTLRQVQWNRRKAAVMLGVSYKTLLNKIKETGLERR